MANIGMKHNGKVEFRLVNAGGLYDGNKFESNIRSTHVVLGYSGSASQPIKSYYMPEEAYRPNNSLKKYKNLLNAVQLFNHSMAMLGVTVGFNIDTALKSHLLSYAEEQIRFPTQWFATQINKCLKTVNPEQNTISILLRYGNSLMERLKDTVFTENPSSEEDWKIALQGCLTYIKWNTMFKGSKMVDHTDKTFADVHIQEGEYCILLTTAA